TARGPIAEHSFATASAASTRRSATTTCAPSRANRSAYALPMPCAAPVMIATLSRSRMGGRRNTHARGPSTRTALLATRFALDLVLEDLDRDRGRMREQVRHVRDRPVDHDLAAVVYGMRVRQRPVLVGGVDGRIERSEAIQRTVRHHRDILLYASSVAAMTVAQFGAAAHPPARKNPRAPHRPRRATARPTPLDSDP